MAVFLFIKIYNFKIICYTIYMKELDAIEQNIYDNTSFFDEYITLRESDENLNDLLEQPAMQKLLPNVKGKSVLDLGCGYGKNCLEFVKNGASKVVGIDISQKMLEIAENEFANENITYKQMSMTDIDKLNQHFDFMYSSLAFHYIEDYDAFCKLMYDNLNNGGCLLFSQEHPLNTSTFDGKGGYNKDENGNRVSYTFSNYNQPGKREITWYVDGVIKYHRTFSNLINGLVNAGFVIEQIVEPAPTEETIKKLPKIVKEFIKPSFIIIKASKK